MGGLRPPTCGPSFLPTWPELKAMPWNVSPAPEGRTEQEALPASCTQSPTSAESGRLSGMHRDFYQTEPPGALHNGPGCPAPRGPLGRLLSQPGRPRLQHVPRGCRVHHRHLKGALSGSSPGQTQPVSSLIHPSPRLRPQPWFGPHGDSPCCSSKGTTAPQRQGTMGTSAKLHSLPEASSHIEAGGQTGGHGGLSTS